MNILDEIFTNKRQELSAQMAVVPVAHIQHAAARAMPPLDFINALRIKAASGFPALIAEVKHRSPSRGVLKSDFNPLHLAKIYAENGAAAISVLTEKQFFGGNLEHLSSISALTPRLPLLRKDFLFHPYQIFEARAAGADAVLLIAAMLPQHVLAQLHSLALGLGMAALVEVHSAQDLETVLELNPSLVGINNRDLTTFEVSLETTLALRSQVPPGICLVAESGIHTAADVERLAEAGVEAILVGEALVIAADIPAKMRELTGTAELGDGG
jgi:indole-3-glycerol phosphate synthase